MELLTCSGGKIPLLSHSEKLAANYFFINRQLKNLGGSIASAYLTLSTNDLSALFRLAFSGGDSKPSSCEQR